MTDEEIAERLYDELQHNRITNSKEYSKRLYDFAELLYEGEDVERCADSVDTIIHNKWSWGFCDMCDEVIFYDEDSWYDLCGDLLDCERERIEERLPADTEIQDVCATCFNKLVAEEGKSQ